MQKNIEHFYKTLWITKGSRFNAFRRVKRIYNWSSVSIVIFSVYIIGINLLVFLDTFSSANSQTVITIINIVLSTFILALSLYLNGRDYKREYQSLHQSGKDVGTIYKKITIIKNNEKWTEDISNSIESYDNIIKSNEYNHTKVDYEKMLLDNSINEGKKKCYLINWFMYYISPILIYLLLIVLPPLILWGIL